MLAYGSYDYYDSYGSSRSGYSDFVDIFIDTGLIWVILGVLICSLACGFATRKINESKGYDGGFAWGFWLGFIGLIVVACKPDNRSSYYSILQSSGSASSLFNNSSEESWRCSRCTRMNPPYQTTCTCGITKTESDRFYNEGDSQQSEPVAVPLPTSKSVSEAEEIVRFKKLLDDGVITEEEFQAKKKQILGI